MNEKKKEALTALIGETIRLIVPTVAKGFRQHPHVDNAEDYIHVLSNFTTNMGFNLLMDAFSNLTEKEAKTLMTDFKKQVNETSDFFIESALKEHYGDKQ